MKSKELYDAGQLPAAIEAAVQEVKSRPTDTRARTFLFELLCFSGDLDRAARQLDVLPSQDQQAEWGVQVYRNILEAERKRRRLFQNGIAPEFLGDCPEHIQWQLEAIAALSSGKADQARELLNRSEEARPALSGQVGEQPFDDFRDCDDLLAPCLEMIVVADYVWVPLDALVEFEVMKPERPRDLLWPAARVMFRDGTQRRGYFFALYPGSYQHADDQVKLGRLTDWIPSAQGPVTGVGQKLFLAGETDYPLLQLETVTFTW